MNHVLGSHFYTWSLPTIQVKQIIFQVAISIPSFPNQNQFLAQPRDTQIEYSSTTEHLIFSIRTNFQPGGGTLGFSIIQHRWIFEPSTPFLMVKLDFKRIILDSQYNASRYVKNIHFSHNQAKPETKYLRQPIRRQQIYQERIFQTVSRVYLFFTVKLDLKRSYSTVSGVNMFLFLYILFAMSSHELTLTFRCSNKIICIFLQLSLILKQSYIKEQSVNGLYTNDNIPSIKLVLQLHLDLFSFLIANYVTIHIYMILI